MTPAELERYLHDHIPLSRAMAVGVVSADAQAVVLSAPLAPNINHRDTVFGGSLSTLAILSAWSLLHVRLTSSQLKARLVIQHNTMAYESPALGAFSATAAAPSRENWNAFVRMFERRGKARIAVSAIVESEGLVAGRFEGDFVALPPAG